jgi:asparagine synthase (glutamine-hydrolysing)
MADGLLDAAYHIEAPINNPNSVAKMVLSRHVRESGLKVCLTGEGSDELFGGYAFFKLEYLWRKLLGTPEERREGEALWQRFQKIEYRTEGILWRRNMKWAQAPRPYGYPSYYRMSMDQASAAMPWLLSKDILAGTNGHNPTAALESEYPTEYLRTLAPFDATRHMALQVMTNYVIPTMGDRVEMANSLECRTPFLDVHVARYAMRLSETHLLQGLREKFVLRKAFEKFLPPFVREETKHPMMAPSWRSLYKTPKGRDVFETLMSQRAVREAGLLNPHTVLLLKALWHSVPRRSRFFPGIDAAIGFLMSMQAVHHTLVKTPIRVAPLAMVRRSVADVFAPRSSVIRLAAG